MLKHRKKRTTFLRLFLSGMILPVLLTAILGAYLVVFIRFHCYQYTNNLMEKIVGDYARRQTNTDLTRKVPDSMMLSLYTEFDYSAGHVILDPENWVEPEIDSLTFTFDRDGNILNSSRAKLLFAVRMNEDPQSSVWYSYDPQDYPYPELEQLFRDKLTDYSENNYYRELDITSAWINEESREFIPHTVNVKVLEMNRGFLGFGDPGEFGRETDSYQITVDAAPEGWVLTEIASRFDKDGSYPCGSIQDVFGCDPELFDRVAAECKDKIADTLSQNVNGSDFGNYRWEEDTEIQIEKLYVNTDEAGILTYIRTNTASLHSWRRLIFVLSLLFGAMTLFVLTLCIIRNAKNKAQYAFEDYQRALTNNLAHDLKTPLAVIGGYTENVLQMRQDCGGEKELEYLRSIMKNVAYTDEIIRKTLLFSETEQVSKLNKTAFDAAKRVGDLTEKYRTALNERGITLNISGSASITADADLFTAAAENLISNAVKYTPDGGSIRITLSQKQLAVVNDAAEDIDTKNLTMPFVKGDRARSDRQSCGLGLAIADAAAKRCGWKLKLHCRDKKFTAELHF